MEEAKKTAAKTTKTTKSETKAPAEKKTTTAKKTTTTKATAEKKTTTKATATKSTTAKKPAAKTTAAKTTASKVAKEEVKAEVKEPVAKKEVKKVANKRELKDPSATLRNARISARKVKIVIDNIRGKNVDEAIAILKFTPKAASPLVEKLLKSAIANAENNNMMNRKDLYVAEIYANQGATMKRIRAATQGRANRIRKRTSHITIVLKERA